MTKRKPARKTAKTPARRKSRRPVRAILDLKSDVADTPSLPPDTAIPTALDIKVVRLSDVSTKHDTFLGKPDFEPARVEYPATWWDAFKARWFPEWVYEGGVIGRPDMVTLELYRRVPGAHVAISG